MDMNCECGKSLKGNSKRCQKCHLANLAKSRIGKAPHEWSEESKAKVKATMKKRYEGQEHHLKGTTQREEWVEKRIKHQRGKKRPDHAKAMRDVYYTRKKGGDVLSFADGKHSENHKKKITGEGNPS